MQFVGVRVTSQKAEQGPGNVAINWFPQSFPVNLNWPLPDHSAFTILLSLTG